PDEVTHTIRCEPEIALGTEREAAWRAVRREAPEFGDAYVRHAIYDTDLIAGRFGKRYAAVRAVRDTAQLAAVRRNIELGEKPARGEPANLVGASLGEPHIAVWPHRDVFWTAVGSG